MILQGINQKFFKNCTWKLSNSIYRQNLASIVLGLCPLIFFHKFHFSEKEMTSGEWGIQVYSSTGSLYVDV